MRKKFLPFVIFMSFALIACQNAEQVIQQDHSPGLKGVDTDSNGIRDDIDKLIQQKFSTTVSQKKAAQLYAKALQRNIEATNKQGALRSTQELANAISCVGKAFPGESNYLKRKELYQELQKWTTNTKERFEASLKVDKLSSGSAISISEHPSCE